MPIRQASPQGDGLHRSAVWAGLGVSPASCTLPGETLARGQSPGKSKNFAEETPRDLFAGGLVPRLTWDRSARALLPLRGRKRHRPRFPHVFAAVENGVQCLKCRQVFTIVRRALHLVVGVFEFAAPIFHFACFEDFSFLPLIEF